VKIQEIKNYLPHRYPFLLVDRVEEMHLDEKIRAYKNVTINEPFFQGHFPDEPIMPGVLIIEAFAQACGVLIFASNESVKDELLFLAGVDKARFKQPVVPGDKLVLDIKLLKIKRGIGQFDCEALVDGKVVASAKLLCAKQPK
jgi:3-hydroxyacyl-[acyl-carrier-protein] dehydratase